MLNARVLFFGRLGDVFGRERDIALPVDGCTLDALRAMLDSGSDPAGKLLRDPSIKACIDRTIVPDDAIVRPGQEIAFLPPLSGG